MSINVKHWFKPARFWRWFAAYYPISWQGWFITLGLFAPTVFVFLQIDARSHSVSDTFIEFAPWAIAVSLVFDFLCLRMGEYPHWWRRK